MHPSLRLMLVPWLCVATGCAPEPEPLPAIGQGDGRVEWRGMLPCADCRGIRVQLVLERRGDARHYQLVETYLAGRAGARFVERGRWRHGHGLLRLQGEDGSLRVYALAPDGRLQSRDSRGRRLPVQDDAMLSPRVP